MVYGDYIWSHINKDIKEAFISVFSKGKLLEIDQWIVLFEKYHHSLTKGFLNASLFPDGYRLYNPINVVCEICNKPFEVEHWWNKRLIASGKKPRCAKCQQRIEAQILAKKAHNIRKQQRRERASIF